jgi:hypothetical protein
MAHRRELASTDDASFVERAPEKSGVPPRAGLSAAPSGQSPHAEGVLRLQRSAGNRAVSRMVARMNQSPRDRPSRAACSDRLAAGGAAAARDRFQIAAAGAEALPPSLAEVAARTFDDYSPACHQAAHFHRCASAHRRSRRRPTRQRFRASRSTSSATLRFWARRPTRALLRRVIADVSAVADGAGEILRRLGKTLPPGLTAALSGLDSYAWSRQRHDRRIGCTSRAPSRAASRLGRSSLRRAASDGWT